MGRKIFVSYKHEDTAVAPLEVNSIISDYPTTARDYVDKIVEIFGDENIYKGEEPDEDISDLEDSMIQQHLSDKIYDSSVTIVLLSKNMQEIGKQESNQWIPWEIAFSLKETTRAGTTSRTNAMLGVVLPDENGSYDHFVTTYRCHRTWHIGNMFPILRHNMFNRKAPNVNTCDCRECYVHTGIDHSFIYPIKWGDFKNNMEYIIDLAVSIKENKDDYEIVKVLDKE